MRRSENTRILENYEQCRDYITQTLEESPCRKNLLTMAEWIYQLHQQCLQATKVSSYVTGSKKDIRFYFGKQGIDHFLCVVPKKMQRCAELGVFYGEGGKKSNFCKEKVQSNNPTSRFCIINSEQVNSMSLQTIKEEVFRAYQTRLGEEYGIRVDRALVFPNAGL